MADVFSKSIDGLLDAKIKGISTSEKKFMSGWDKIEKHIFKRVVDYTRKMGSTGGVLDFDENNVDQVNALNKTVLDAINSSDYPDKVKDYLRDFDQIKKNNIDIHKSVNNLSGPELEKLINPVQKQMVDQTVTGLTGSGIDTDFIQPMKEGIMKNIVAGSTITELESFIDGFIVSNPDRLGRLTNYSQQIARDTLNQYDGQINSRIATEFGLNAGRYVGSLIDDSRAQCVRWVGKGVLLFEDLETEINWANNNGSGMIPGTNPANFATYRGGYNCRHSFIPFKMTKSQRAEYEEDQKAQQSPVVVATPAKVQAQTTQVSNGVKKVQAKSAAATKAGKLNPDLFLSTQSDDTNKSFLDIVENTDDVISEGNKRGTMFSLRTPQESTLAGGQKMLDATGSKKSLSQIYKVDSGSNGNCAKDASFLNVKIEKGEKILFEPIEFIQINDDGVDDFLAANPGTKLGIDKKTGLKFIGQEVSPGKTRVTFEQLKPGDPLLPWTNSSLAKGNKAPTLTHELAHMMQFQRDPNLIEFKNVLSDLNLTLKDSPTVYGSTNNFEFWTESLTKYVYSNKQMKIQNPKVFEMVEKYISKMGIDKKTIRIATQKTKK
jgi:hypothetical protein